VTASVPELESGHEGQIAIHDSRDRLGQTDRMLSQDDRRGNLWNESEHNSFTLFCTNLICQLVQNLSGPWITKQFSQTFFKRGTVFELVLLLTKAQ